MNLRFTQEGDIYDSNDNLIASVSDSLKLDRLYEQKKDIIAEFIQVWNDSPGMLPLGTKLTINFKDAYIKYANSGKQHRPASSIEDMDVLRIFEPEEEDKLGFSFADDDSKLWVLVYSRTEISYQNPSHLE